MIIGIISDIHDHIDLLDKALQHLKEQGAEEIIVCGDLCSPFVIPKLGKANIKTHVVFGNNDGDRFLIAEKAKDFPQIKIHGEYIGDEDYLLQIDGVRIGVTHYPFYAKTMAKTGWYDAVFYGHSHTAYKQKYGNCLLLNPGSVAGLEQQPGYAIYDTVLRSSELKLIGEANNLSESQPF